MHVVRLGRRALEQAIADSALPAEPDRGAVDAFIVETYREAWGW